MKKGTAGVGYPLATFGLIEILDKPLSDNGPNHAPLQQLRANWLISRRMAEINHSHPRNFSPPCEFV
jgi:hypothetical protein